MEDGGEKTRFRGARRSRCARRDATRRVENAVTLHIRDAPDNKIFEAFDTLHIILRVRRTPEGTAVDSEIGPPVSRGHLNMHHA